MLRWATVVELQKEAVKELRCVCGGDAGLFAADRRGVLAWSAAGGDFELKAPRRKDEMPGVVALVGGTGLWCGLGSGTIAIYDTEKWSAPPNTLVGAHSAEVTAICSAFGGFAAISGSADFSVKSWDLKGRCLSVLSAHHAPVKCLAAHGAEAVWTGAGDGTVFVARDQESEGKLSPEEGQVLKLPGPGGASGIRCLKNLGGKMWAGTDDGRVAIWDGPTLEFEGEAQFHSEAVTAIQDMGDDVWTGGADKKILCWDTHQRPPMMKYAVGTQDGYVKAMVRQGWSLWSFTSKGSKVFASAGLSDEADRKAAGLEGKIEELTAQLSLQIKSAEDLSQRSQESEAALTELQAASETQGAELVRAQADLESIRAELAGRVEAEEVARTALETAKQEALSAREEVGARERSLEEAQARNAQERTDLVGQLGVATTTAEQARTELAEARSALQGCQNEREVLEGKVGEGREAAEILRKELGTLKSLRETESQEDAARIAELEARALESQARQLKELDALREGLLKEKSEQRDTAQEMLAAARAERDQILQESHARIQKVEEEKAALRMETDRLVQQQADATEAALKAHAQEREELVARSQTKVGELRAAMEEATAERAAAVEELRSELAAARTEARAAGEAAEAADRQHARDAEAAEARAVAELTAVRCTLEERAATLEGQKAQLEAQLGARAARLEAELAEYRSAAAEQAREQAVVLEAQRTEAAEAAATHQKEKRSLEVALQMSKAAVHELSGSTRDLEVELEDTKAEQSEQLREVQAEIATHRAAAETAAAEEAARAAALKEKIAAAEEALGRERSMREQER